MPGAAGGGNASVGPSGFGDGSHWWRVVTLGATMQNNRAATKADATREAEAALALLGYRVRKGEA